MQLFTKMGIKWSLAALCAVLGLIYYCFFKPPFQFPSECAFCERKVLDVQTFYKGKLVSALYTHRPIVAGHCLIVPHRHVERFEDLNAEEVVEMLDVIGRVNLASQNVFQSVSYFLLQKNGIEAGQSVPHVHFHYIPQKQREGSVFQFVFRSILVNTLPPIKEEEMRGIVAKMKWAMENNPPKKDA